jgi:hypothetical protein
MGKDRNKAAYLNCLVICALLGTACTTQVRVAHDSKLDFSQFQTWMWGAQEEARIEAPHREDILALDGLVAGHIERALGQQGLQRVAEDPDLYIGYQLVLVRRHEAVDVPLAMDWIYSNSDAPSYVVGGSTREDREYDDLHLTMALRDREGVVVWRASLLLPARIDEPLPLEKATSKLVARLPR